MDFQFKTKSQVKSNFFADKRGSRGTVPGTVYVGKLTQGSEQMMDEAAYLLYYYGLEEKEVAAVVSEPVGATTTEESPPATPDVAAPTPTAPAEGEAIAAAPVTPPVSPGTKRVFATNFPKDLPLNMDTMKRGQERFDIYCAPCHGTAGYGNGLVNRRIQISNKDDGELNDSPTWTLPADLTDGSVVTQPAGQLFYSMSFGKGEMAGYSAQITEKDRWAITFYLRALQRRANASKSDVPASTKLLPPQSNE
jgi:mono/diheme cytochrome c family protein